ncbi:hypothetical protein HYV44_00885 [Candidatus Microgenomates bacterium]|nr:hypothetical protein [Candidatus Microgenomates bacterium]
MDNWREFVFYIKTRHPFCEPTYFSFFGLLNIQRKAIPVPFDDSEFRKKCVDVMDRHIQRDNHHFEGTKNFSFRNGQLMMVDYGSPKTQGVIRDWGEKLMDNFHSNETPPLKK